MRIALAGATGFTGKRMLDLLLERGHSVTCLVRAESRTESLAGRGLDVVVGDLEDAGAIAAALDGHDAFASAGPLTPDIARAVVAAARDARLHRVLVIGSTSIFTTLSAKSKARKTEAEDVVRQSGLRYTVLRPTMIYGTHEDRNMCRLVQYVSTHRFVPIFGTGEFLQQPVYVQDLARAAVLALESPTSVGKAYDVAGGNALSYNEVIDTTARLLGRRVTRVHIPLRLSLFLVRLYWRIAPNPRLHGEQILRLNEDKAFSTEEIERDLGYTALTFEEGMTREVAEIREWEGSH
ncbi:MAG: NAD(P)H-binding protein [Candidatus Eisenbacteria bacterium]